MNRLCTGETAVVWEFHCLLGPSIVPGLAVAPRSLSPFLSSLCGYGMLFESA